MMRPRHLNNDQLRDTARRMELSITGAPGDLQTAAMVEVIHAAVSHQDDCYLCGEGMHEECGEYTNGELLAMAWRVSCGLHATDLR